MKLIIDVDENVFLAYKRCFKEGAAQWAETIIANGAPYEERPQVTVFCENADEKTTKELKAELERLNNEFMKCYRRVKNTSLGDVGKVCDVCAFRNKKFDRACEECRNHDTFIFDGYVKKVDGEK